MASTNILEDILTTLDLQGVLYFHTNFRGEWGVSVPRFGSAARFHHVIEGTCFVSVANDTTYKLTKGDLIVVPGGRSHVLADRQTRDAPPLEDVLEKAQFTGKGALTVGSPDVAASTRLICGHFSFRPEGRHPLLSALPDALVVTKAEIQENRWLDELLSALTRQIDSGESGAPSTVIRVSEIIFIEAVRTGSHKYPVLHAMLAAFQSGSIRHAMELMHTQLTEPWTVESLATTVGMSRSSFAQQFKTLLGVTPMGYLTDWRLQRSLSLLATTNAPVGKVAVDVGYKSAAAFTRVFTSRFDVSPSSFRDRAKRESQRL